jgi:hypothetical protein
MAGIRRWQIACGIALGLIAGAVWAKPKETPPAKAPPAPPPNDCDMSNVEKIPFCPTCKKFVERAEVDGGKHKPCEAKLTVASACVKVCYTCRTCGKMSRTSGKCKEDKAELEKVVSKAAIVYRCPTCKTTSHDPGKCTSKGECKGKTLVMTCEQSGMVPHVRTWPQN